MKAVAAPRPWPMLAVFDQVEVLNMPFKTAHRGDVLLYAAPPTQPDAMMLANYRFKQLHWQANPYRDVRDAFVGVVRVVNVCRPDECDLLFARGPWVWTVAKPRVLLEPVPAARFKGVKDVVLPEHLAWAELLTPDAWHRAQRSNQPADPEAVYPDRPGGWAGD